MHVTVGHGLAQQRLGLVWHDMTLAHTHNIHMHNVAHRTNDPILQHASRNNIPTPVAKSTSTRRLRISKVIMQIRLCNTDWA